LDASLHGGARRKGKANTARKRGKERADPEEGKPAPLGFGRLQGGGERKKERKEYRIVKSGGGTRKGVRQETIVIFPTDFPCEEKTEKV